MFYTSKITKFLLVLVLMLTIIYTPLINKQAVPKAEALFGSGGAVVVIGGPGTFSQKIAAVKSTLSAASTAITAHSAVTLLGKEFFLDAIGFELAQMILKQITSSIVNWINSGFQGSPAFLSDFKGFIKDIANKEFGNLIKGTELEFMCSPFKLDVKIALSVQYQAQKDFKNKVQCTLTDVVSNAKGFINGNFGQGGWAGWLEITQRPQNTPYGAYLAAETELRARIVDAKGREIKKLDWGQGTFSKTLCELVEGPGKPQKNCFINMPGKYISESLTFTVQGAQRKLITADEINEIIGALFAQLAQKAITGAKGLLGLSESGYSGGGGSYLDNMRAETIGTNRNSLTIFENAFLDESNYQAVFVGVVGEVDNLNSENQANRISYSGCYSLNIPISTITFRNDALLTASTSSSTLNILSGIMTTLNSTSTTPETKQVVFDEYQTMLSTGQLHNTVDIAQAEFDLEAFHTTISDFRSQMTDEVKRCQVIQAQTRNTGPIDEINPFGL